MPIEIFMGAARQIRRHAAGAYPEECCGLLLGVGDRVLELVPSANVAGDPTRRFEINPALLLQTHRRARLEGLAILGPYHSHPAGRLVPSPCDAEEAQTGQIWIIASATELTAWRFTAAGEFAPMDLRILA